MQPLQVQCFGGENAEQYNALMSALFHAAEGEEQVYNFMALPKTSFTVELVDALNALGYEIRKK